MAYDDDDDDDFVEEEEEEEENDSPFELPPECDTQLQLWLEEEDACWEARSWVGAQSLKEAWDACPDSYWMDYVIRRSIRHIDEDFCCVECHFHTTMADITPEMIRQDFPYARVLSGLQHRYPHITFE